jgi:NTE family protein
MQAPLLEKTALCVSGGGYRAMLFHLGAFWYLSDAKILPEVDRISSVSGGSITAALLGLRWTAIGFGTAGHAKRFRTLVVEPIREMACRTIDAQSVLAGTFLPGTISDRITKKYDEVLFRNGTLQDLPDSPRFVINATNVQSGALFRFSKPYIGDYRVGRVLKPRRPLAEAVTASSAFPPILSPARLTFRNEEWAPDSGLDLQKPPYTTNVLLTDGGVYDNMALQTAEKYKTLLVSDAGAKMQAEEAPRANPVQHSLRCNALIDNQVRSLRRIHLINDYQSGTREGVYWGMWTDPAGYPGSSRLSLPFARARELAAFETRLRKVEPAIQERLINFGYGMAERAIRGRWRDTALEATDFPYHGGI